MTRERQVFVTLLLVLCTLAATQQHSHPTKGPEYDGFESVVGHDEISGSAQKAIDEISVAVEQAKQQVNQINQMNHNNTYKVMNLAQTNNDDTVGMYGGHGERSQGEAECDFVKQNCNTVQNKIPTVVQPPPSGLTVETGLSPQDKYDFEHLFGQALRETSPVKWATNEFIERMTQVLSLGAAYINGTHPDDVLLMAYGGGSKHNTGYNGPSISDIRYALSDNGNIREKWALAYVLQKSHYFDSVFMPICKEANRSKNTTFISQSLGMNAAELMKQYNEIEETKNDLNKSQSYSRGFPEFGFLDFQNWARFDFDGPEGTWKAARSGKKNGCIETPKMTNDTQIQPPLSPYEIAYQCGQNTGVCKLSWWPGALCYDMNDTPFAENVSGYVSRAKALSYRFAAGPSGTTANMLGYANLLGFEEEELVLVRLAMAAWMLPTDDHSMYEILLGGDSYVPDDFRLLNGLKDVQMFMPRDIHAGNDDGSSKIIFRAKEVWSAFGEKLGSERGQEVCGNMMQESREFLTQLTGQKC